MKHNDYTRIPIWIIVMAVIGGFAVFMAGAILEELAATAAGAAATALGMLLVIFSDDKCYAASTPEPALYRYGVELYGETEAAVVYAASVNTDELDAQTVHFEDFDGNTIAIYSHVSRVVGRKVASEED